MMLDYNHYNGLGLVGETLPQAHTEVTLDAMGRDQFGLPIPVVSFSWVDNDRRLFAAGTEKQREILRAAGAEVTFDADDTRTFGGAGATVAAHRLTTLDHPDLWNQLQTERSFHHGRYRCPTPVRRP